MTYQECYQKAKKRLQEAGVESPAFDAMCLFEKAYGWDRTGLAVHGAEEAPENGFWELVSRRAEREPLQYLLGEWEFRGRKYAVGEGVLIPREETELLVDTTVELLQKAGYGKDSSAVIFDLCAGTGAVGISLAEEFPEAKVYCVEWYPEAMGYLQKNLQRAGLPGACAIKGDVLAGPEGLGLPEADAIVSNPPYVRAAVVPTLQEEVRREPRTALDGGAEGLDFYQAICEKWLPVLRPDGVVAFEIGEDQGKAVAEILSQTSVAGIEVRQDFSGLDRVVAGRKNL